MAYRIISAKYIPEFGEWIMPLSLSLNEDVEDFFESEPALLTVGERKLKLTPFEELTFVVSGGKDGYVLQASEWSFVIILEEEDEYQPFQERFENLLDQALNC